MVERVGNEDEITDAEGLNSRSVAVNFGSNFEQLLNEPPYADEIDIRTYESNIEQDTALGRVDSFVMDRVSSAQGKARCRWRSPVSRSRRSATPCSSATTRRAAPCAIAPMRY